MMSGTTAGFWKNGPSRNLLMVCVKRTPFIPLRISQRALRETMSLFSRIAVQTAGALGYEYPAEGDKYVVSLIENYLNRK
jgi:hypothetical protein